MLARAAHTVILAWGIRRIAIAFVIGVIGVLAIEPFSIWPVMFVSFTLLTWLIDGAAATRGRGIWPSFVIGWWFGFGYLVAGW